MWDNEDSSMLKNWLQALKDRMRLPATERDVLLDCESLDCNIFCNYYTNDYSMTKISTLFISIEKNIYLMKRFISFMKMNAPIPAFEYTGNQQLISIQDFLLTEDRKYLNLYSTCSEFKTTVIDLWQSLQLEETEVRLANKEKANRFILSIRIIIEQLLDMQERKEKG